MIHKSRKSSANRLVRIIFIFEEFTVFENVIFFSAEYPTKCLEYYLCAENFNQKGI